MKTSSERYKKSAGRSGLSSFRALLIAAVAAAFSAGCFGGEPIVIGGSVYTSLEVEEKYYRVVGDTNTEAPASNLGPMEAAVVRLDAPGHSNISPVQKRTNVEGKFEISLPVTLLNTVDRVRLVFQPAGFKPEIFILRVADIREARKAVRKTHYLEFWLPPSEPDL